MCSISGTMYSKTCYQVSMPACVLRSPVYDDDDNNKSVKSSDKQYVMYLLYLLWSTLVGSHDEPSPLNSVLHEVDEILLMNAGVLDEQIRIGQPRSSLGTGSLLWAPEN